MKPLYDHIRPLTPPRRKPAWWWILGEAIVTISGAVTFCGMVYWIMDIGSNAP